MNCVNMMKPRDVDGENFVFLIFKTNVKVLIR